MPSARPGQSPDVYMNGEKMSEQMNIHKDWESREAELRQLHCQRHLHEKLSQVRPFDQCLGSKYLFRTEGDVGGKSSWDAVKPIKVSLLDLAFEQ